MFASLLGLTLLVILVSACNFGPDDEPPPSSDPVVDQPVDQPTPAPSNPHPSSHPSTTPTPPQDTPPDDTPVETEPVKLGVIFITDIKSGTFKIKAGEKVSTNHFQATGNDLTRVEANLLFPSDVKQLKFVVRDDKGGKGKRGLPIHWKPGTSHVIKVKSVGSPNSIVIVQ